MKYTESQVVEVCFQLICATDEIEHMRGAMEMQSTTGNYVRYFVLLCSKANQQFPGVIPMEFALLTISRICEARAEKNAACCAERYAADEKLFAEISAARAVETIEGAGELNALQQFVTERLDNAMQEVERVLQLPLDETLLKNSDQIIRTCIARVKRRKKESGEGFSDAKYVQYYAFFLNELLRLELPLGSSAAWFFNCVAGQIGVRDVARRSAMEYKFYNALSIFQQANRMTVEQARRNALAYIERSHSEKTLLPGMQAAKILENVFRG